MEVLMGLTESCNSTYLTYNMPGSAKLHEPVYVRFP
jgi:hypothetical protein